MEKAYFDLFDDELWEVSKGDRTKERPLLDTIRFKIVLAMVSGKTLVVPEQWAVSSPSFLRIAAELLPPFFEDRKAGRATRLPFLIGFFDFRTFSHGSNPYRAAIVDRLSNIKRRLKFSDAVDTEQRQDAGSARQKIASVIKLADPYDANLIERLAVLIEDQKVAEGMVQLLRYCEIPEAAVSFQNTHYNGSLASHLLRVRKFVLEDIEWTLDAVGEDSPVNLYPLNDSDFEVVSEAKDFFSSPEAQDNPGAYVMLMEHARERYSSAGATFIEIMGRVGMHAAFGNSLSVDVSSHIHGKFKSQPSTMALTEFFCDSLFINQGANSEPVLSKEFIFDRNETTNINWYDAWSSVQVVSAEQKWQDLLQTQNIRLAAAGYMSDDLTDKILRDCMLENVDFLNSRLRQIRIETQPNFRQLGGAFFIRSYTGAASGIVTAGAQFPGMLDSAEPTTQIISTVATFGALLTLPQSVKLGRQIAKNCDASEARITNVSIR